MVQARMALVSGCCSSCYRKENKSYNRAKSKERSYHKETGGLNKSIVFMLVFTATLPTLIIVPLTMV
jgi:hypothetical protein